MHEDQEFILAAHAPAQAPGFRIVWKKDVLDYFPLTGEIRVADKEQGGVRSVYLRRSKKGAASSGNTSSEFKPFCLTFYLGHGCNLDCTYCYVADKATLPRFSINDDAIRRASQAVASNAAERNKPMVVGFHGGTEPLMQPALIQHILEICAAAAKEHPVAMIRHTTTNGVIPADVALWAAQTFEAITLSWDGPADIHDRYRLTVDGGATHARTQATAAIFTGPESRIGQLKVRATVSKYGVSRLVEIVRYFHRAGIRRAEFYPIFTTAKDDSLLQMSPAREEFVGNFLAARRWGQSNGMEVIYAGTRLEDLHDKFCTIFQDNLTITPDGALTACFKRTHNRNAENDRWMIGAIDGQDSQPVVSQRRVVGLNVLLGAPWPQCRECFNRFHCAKGCPDVCPISDPAEKTFDCTIEKSIGLANLLTAAGIELSVDEQLNFGTAYRNASINPIVE
jgi:uncharacterized protein